MCYECGQHLKEVPNSEYSNRDWKNRIKGREEPKGIVGLHREYSEKTYQQRSESMLMQFQITQQRQQIWMTGNAEWKRLDTMLPAWLGPEEPVMPARDPWTGSTQLGSLMRLLKETDVNQETQPVYVERKDAETETPKEEEEQWF